MSCSINTTTGLLTGSFSVAANSVWTGVGVQVIVTGNAVGDTPAGAAIPTFQVVPNLVVSPTNGSAGSIINYAGSGFKTLGVAYNAGPACSGFAAGKIGGSPVTDPSACHEDTVGNVWGSFTIAGPAPPSGTYTVEFQDDSAGGPTAITTFQKTGGPIISLTQYQGQVGTVVTVTGSGFNGADTSVSISDAGNHLFTPSPLTCSVSGGNIAAGCTFTVSATSGGLVGGFTLTATGNPIGDSSGASFLVLATLTLTPNNGGPNTGTGAHTVAMSGSGYVAGAPTDCKAGTTSSPGGLFVPPPTSCSIAADGTLTGSFFVDVAATIGPYTVTLANGGWGAKVPQTSVSAGFTVTYPSITLSRSSGSGGDTVTVSGGGFSSGDGTCTITPSAIIEGTYSCTVSSSGSVTGSFVVKTSANGAGPSTVTVKGSLGDSATYTFTTVPKITLTPSTNVRVGTSITVSGSNFAAGDSGKTCGAGVSITAIPSDIFAAAPSCSIDANFLLTGSFAIFVAAASTSYTVTATGSGGASDSAFTTLTILPHVVTLSPSSGPVGASISVTGTGFAVSDTCNAGSITGPAVTSAACSASGGTLTGSFVVASHAPGVTTVTLTAVGPLDVGSASFTITPGISLLPASGRAGTNVLVTGTNFANPTDTGCSIASSPSGLISSPLCSVAAGSMSGSFTVATGANGAYSVIVTGTPTGDAGSATFNAPSAPTLTLSPNTGPVGQSVIASGSNYAGTTCLMTASPGSLFTSMTCSIAAGGLTGGFTVGSGASGSYTVTVTTNAGSLDSATATFTATVGPAPTFTLNPITGPVGTAVIASGSNYAGTSCTLSSSPPGLLSAPTCAISAHTLTGGFAVPSSASTGSYVVTVTSNVGETVVATFTVTGPPTPTLTLTPNSGLEGSSVIVSGSNYAGTTCSLSGSLSGLFASSTCSISSGTLSGSFTVASAAPPGSYTVTVTTNVASDTKSATFTVVASTLTLTPTSGPTGTVVAVSGSNYQGTGCNLGSSPASLFTSATCTVSSGTLTGSFTVASAAPLGSNTVTVTTNAAADTRSATFTVTTGPPPPTTFSLNPTSGPAGTVVTASGSNYLGTTCSLSSSPSGLLSSATCFVAGGSLAGGFVVASGASPGSYQVTVATNVAGDTKTATFTVPAPTLTLSPATGPYGTTVAASGLNYAGTTCTLSATPSTLFTSSSCNIAGGSLSGGFTVATTANAGSYTVTVTTNTAGETKSATFTVQAPPVPPCLIATATFGSATAPAVQFLRDFRDHQILSTASGTAFMTLFNAWYYSFSPYVAGYISTHSFERTAMLGVLIPLVGILEISSATFTATSAFPEFAAIISGLVASSLIGAFYLGLPLSLLRTKVRRLRRSRGQTLEKTLTAMLLGGLVVLVVGELLASPVLLMISSAAVLLSALFLSAAFTSGRIARKLQTL